MFVLVSVDFKCSLPMFLWYIKNTEKFSNISLVTHKLTLNSYDRSSR